MCFRVLRLIYLVATLVRWCMILGKSDYRQATWTDLDYNTGDPSANKEPLKAKNNYKTIGRGLVLILYPYSMI